LIFKKWLLPPIFQKEQLVRNAKLLIRAAEVMKIPAIVTTQYSRGLGNTVSEVACLLPQIEPVDKEQFSCFGSDMFSAALKRVPGNCNIAIRFCWWHGMPYLHHANGIGRAKRGI
jgi:hypothetical protein